LAGTLTDRSISTMDEKISLEAISIYGDSFADKLLKGFFSSKDQITGKEILSLSKIQQVNLFVVKELFKSWREETRKQRSSYFDNEHPEVKEALSNYMAVISNHILIDQKHFAPLLKKAVSQTLLVIFDPYDFYSMIIAGNNNSMDVTAFREEIKYLKINKAPLERMLQKLEEKGVKHIAGNEAFAILDQILEEVSFTPEDVEQYTKQFSEIVPLEPEHFYLPRQPEKQNVSRPQERVKEEAPQFTPTSTKSSGGGEHSPAVMDSLRKIAKIKEALSINQKFMFTKVLFYGDFDSFSRAIDELDQQSNMQSALEYLNQYSAGWDRDSKEFHEFMEMVEKRFA
jgi:hypothetical protein